MTTSRHRLPTPAPSAPAARTLSEHAEEKMWNLFKDSANQVGSHYEGDKTGKTVTDCITYVRLVLEYAFQKVGNAAAVSGVRAHYTKGTDLARYLTGIGWSAYYWNPDVRNPRNGVSEHPFSYQTTVRSGSYKNVPVKGYIINYNLTPTAPSRTKKPARVPETTAFDAFKKVKFSFGLANGGMHTFLLSYGMLYEVHWSANGSDPSSKLYERSPFYDYSNTFLSGLAVTPPDSGFSLP